MATDEMPIDRLYMTSAGPPRSSVDGDDDALLQYLYEKSSDSRAKCYDCLSMSGLARMSRDTSESADDSDRDFMSRSTEQICSKTLSLAGCNTAAGSQVPTVVRSCRSQENYMELSDMICVDIDIDDNLASSVDALHYRESFVSRTSDSSGSVDAVELENGDQSVPVTTPEDYKTPDDMVEVSSAEDLSCYEQEKPTLVIQEPSMIEDNESSSNVDEPDGGGEEGQTNEDAAAGFDDEGEVQGRTCLKDADRPSAARLAKRLFYLDGFRKTDVSPHLSKKSVKQTCFVINHVDDSRGSIKPGFHVSELTARVDG